MLEIAPAKETKFNDFLSPCQATTQLQRVSIHGPRPQQNDVPTCRVSYKRDAPTNILSLNIPMEAAANKDQVEEYQVPPSPAQDLSRIFRIKGVLGISLQLYL